jgi:sugar O-acyltransferase (sialic acid O-acetyltransferase NeuD family)
MKSVSVKDIAIYGFGGFGRELACLLKKINEIEKTWNLIGYFDDGFEIGTENRYAKVLGGIEVLNSYNKPLDVVIAIANPQTIDKIVNKITNSNIDFPNIIAPNVNVFDTDAFEIGKGNVIFWGCRLSCDVAIGNFNLINGAVSLGHDVRIGDFNVLGPSTRLSGNCMAGNRNLFGVQSVVLQGVKIGNDTRIGIGSVIIRNTKDETFYIGNPAKRVEGI